METPRISKMRLSALALSLATAGAGCDASQRGRDASAPLSHRVAEVSIRIDVPTAGAPSISVLAFRAAAAGVPADEVLGVVDPLVAAPPQAGCELREVAGPARSLRIEGGSLELEELPHVEVGFGDQGSTLRPTARVYPQLASVVGGLVAEAGPLDTTGVPDTVTVSMPELEAGEGVVLAAGPAPRLLDDARVALVSGARITAGRDLPLVVDGPARSFLEVRPFGATLALACPAAADGRVVIPREHLNRLAVAGGNVPVSFEAVWRERRLVFVAGQPTRLSVETRSSVVLDLRP